MLGCNPALVNRTSDWMQAHLGSAVGSTGYNRGFAERWQSGRMYLTRNQAYG